MGATFTGLCGKGVRMQPNPIHRLPPEVLACILLCVNTYDLTLPLNYTDHTDLEESLANHFEWSPLNLSGVCRYWRNVALTTPRLWTKIYTGPDSIELVRLFLLRSKGAPLKVFADITSACDISTFGLILPHFHRLQWLCLVVWPLPRTNWEDVTPFVSNLPTSATQLESLYISYGGEPLKPNGSPISFYGSYTSPRLQALVMNEYPWDWSQDVFPQSLTHLTLAYAYKDEYSLMDVLNALRPLCALKHLCLKHTLNTDPDADTFPLLTQPPILLPFLQTLDLSSPVLPGCDFLDHFQLPHTAQLKLCFSDLSTDVQFEQLGLRVPSLLLRLASVGGISQPTYRLEVDWKLSTLRFCKEGQNADEAADVSFRQFYRPTEERFWTVFPYLQLQHVTTFSISNVGDTYTRPLFSWPEASRSLKNVESLEIATTNPEGIIFLFSTSPFSDGSILLAFPKLKYLTLRSVEFGTCEWAKKTVDLATYLGRVLQAKLESRQHLDVERVVVQTSQVKQAEIDVLRKFAEVEWDCLAKLPEGTKWW